MKDLPNNIENLPKVSPLLNDEIVEKDYTSGITDEGKTEPQQKEQPPKEPQKPPEQPPTPEDDKAKVDDYSDSFKQPTGEDHTKGFAFDQYQETEGEAPPGFDESGEQKEGAGGEGTLPEATAEEFAEMIGEAFGIYVPQFSYGFVRVDINNIQFHIEQGNIRPEFKTVFTQCNKNSEEALKFSDEELRMFKNSLQKYLEYKNVTFANPETAFWANVAILGTKQIYVINKLMKENQRLVYETIQATNPDFTVKKKKEKKKEKEKEKEEKSESDENSEKKED